MMSKRFYIYRNFTVEPIFHTLENCDFSGYGDTNYLSDYDYYVWFYQCPITPNTGKIAEEINFYIKKLKYLLTQVNETDTILCLTISPYGSSIDELDKFLIGKTPALLTRQSTSGAEEIIFSTDPSSKRSA